MPANVEAMFSVVETPWHREGRILDRPPTVQDGLEAAGLNWTVSMQAIEAVLPDGTRISVPHKRAIVRDDNHQALGVVGTGYRPIQNVEAFRTFEPAIEAGKLELATAGVLKGGARVWVLAKSGEPVDVAKGDAVDPYLLLTHTHDGSGSFQARPTSVRVVCQNTLNAALSGGGIDARIYHTVGAGDHLERLGTILAQAEQSFTKSVETWQHLAAKQVNPERYFAAVVRSKSSTPSTEDLSKQGAELVSELLAAYDIAPGSSSARGSAWHAYNAITYHVDHVRGADTTKTGRPRSTDEQRLTSMWFGSGAQLREDAFKIAIEMADGSTEYVTAPEASSLGVDYGQLGRALLHDMLGN